MKTRPLTRHTISLLLALVFLLTFSAGFARAGDFGIGADLSFLKQAEDEGTQFKDNGNAKPGLQIFRDHGYSWIRLRVLIEPTRMKQDRKYTIAMAQDAKKLGFKIHLDFMYSTAWADPTGQPTPRIWQDMTHAQRSQAVFEFTRDTIAAYRDAGVLPDMVQIGNEVSNGMLWPDGKTPNWDSFIDYLNSGINGVDAGRGNYTRPKIMIHVDHGGDITKTRAFFDQIRAYGVPYDVIGFSFYPWSHGTIADLRGNLAFASKEYDKDVMVVETGYYYQPSKYFQELLPPFPETPEGQSQWLQEVARAVMETPGNRGKGVYWWEPATNGDLRPRGYFDADGNAEPVLSALDKFVLPLHRTDGQ